MRRKIVAANWKMNLDYKQAKQFCAELKKGLPKVKSTAEIILFPNATFLSAASELFHRSKKVSVGAQNVYPGKSGAFTGEISADMILSSGARYVLCGHSERRNIFHETDEMVSRKVFAALQAGLAVIFCVGEPLEIRQKNRQNEWVADQLRSVFNDFDKKHLDKIIIAYEPVWAIGTGSNATSQQAQEMHAFIRKELQNLLGPKGASLPILYGGSCNPSNAAELFSCKDVDGGLIGGASLQADSFLKIVAASR